MKRDIYELIEKMIDKKVKGADTYINNGSRWLIFTDEKKWIFELTKEGTLWYNYYFFENIFKIISLNVVDNQHHITKWVENFIRNGVKDTGAGVIHLPSKVEDTIQNGVKNTFQFLYQSELEVEDTIQNGVKNTDWCQIGTSTSIEDAIQNGVKETNGIKPFLFIPVEVVIQNGVKETKHNPFEDGLAMEEAIQNGIKVTIDQWNQNRPSVKDVLEKGVKHTEYGDWLDGDERFDDIIKNGIKETNLEDHHRLREVVQTVKNGIKETTPGGYLGSVEMKGKTVHQFEHSKQDDDVKDVIKNGIKHTEISWSNFDRVDDVLEKSIKKTEAAALFDESKIDTVISEGIKETHDDVMPHTGRVEGVIKNGVKKTVDALSSRLPNPVKDVIKNGVKICIPSRTPLYNPMDFSVQYRENHRLDDVASVLEKGIKEVQPLPSQEGNMDWGNYYHKQEDRTKPHTKYVDDVITNGIKKTKAMDEWVNTDRIVDGVISKGVKKSPI